MMALAISGISTGAGQARLLDRKYIDPVIEVGAEGAIIDPRTDILMGGADKPEINLDLVISTSSLNGAVFQHPAALSAAAVAYRRFHQGIGAAACQLDTPLARLVGTGENLSRAKISDSAVLRGSLRN